MGIRTTLHHWHQTPVTEKKTKRVGKIIPALFCFLSYITQYWSFNRHERNILEFARYELFPDLPGLEHSLKKQKPSPGKIFELESALWIRSTLHEAIEGFDVNIVFDPQEISLPEFGITLKQTEYDVVTPKYVIECKSGNLKKPKAQICKEFMLLRWFQLVVDDLQANQLEFTIERRAHGHFWFVLCGPSTQGQKVAMFTSWIYTTDKDEFATQWLDLITTLAQKELLLVSKKPIPESVKALTSSFNISFYENVRYTP